MAFEHYKLLEVSHEATPDEIKKAYYRSIRKHSPDKDPEGYKLIVAAYETLSDPKGRAEYDSLQKHGGAIEELMRSVDESEEKENWSEAIRLLKKVIVLAPELEEPKNRLGLAFIWNNKLDDAILVFQKLTVSSPATPLYWRNLGFAHRAKARLFDKGTLERGESTKKAVNAFEKAHNLEEINLKDYLEIAECHLVNNDYNLAVLWAERAIGGNKDLTAFEAIIFIIRAHIYEGNTQKLELASRRVSNLLPDDEDTRKFAAGRLAQLAHELSQSAKENRYEGLFEPSAILLKLAHQLNPVDAELREYHKLISSIAIALNEYDQFNEDKNVLDGFKMIGIYLLSEAIGENVKEWEWNLNDAFERLDGLPNAEILSGIRLFRKKYPSIFWLSDNILNKIEEDLLKEEKEAEAKKEKERKAEQKRREIAQREEEERRQNRINAENERKRREEEERRRHEVEVLRIKKLEEENRLQRLLWWKRYGWLVALAVIVAITFLFPIGKKQYALYKVAEAARIEQQRIEEQARFEQLERDERKRILQEQKDEKKRLALIKAEEKRMKAELSRVGMHKVNEFTVFDKNSGLTWTIDVGLAYRPLQPSQVKGLLADMSRNQYGGKNDWRLPSNTELTTILSHSGSKAPIGFLNSLGFANVRPDKYCTSDTNTSGESTDGTVDFNDGTVGTSLEECYVWPVSGKITLVKNDDINSTKTPPAYDYSENKIESAKITRNDVSKFIEQYLESTNARNIDGIMSAYADRVNYFAWGDSTKLAIRKDKVAHFKRWQQINSNFDGDFSMNEIPGSSDKMSVSFRFNFYVKNDKKAVKGVAEQKWILAKPDNSLMIIDEKQNVRNRDIQNY